MPTTYEIKIGQTVYIGTSKTQYVVLDKVNEFQLRIIHKREHDKGNTDKGWLVDVASVRA